MTVSPPGPSTSAIESAVQTFVSSYNAIIDQINGQTSQVPSSSDPTQGTLYGDDELNDLVSSMRQQNYTPNSSLTGIASLADIGITTGAATGILSVLPGCRRRQTDGQHVDTRVRNRVESEWRQGNARELVNALPRSSTTSPPPGARSTCASRAIPPTWRSHEPDQRHERDVGRSPAALQTEFADMETALQQSQTQSNWLSGQIASLPTHWRQHRTPGAPQSPPAPSDDKDRASCTSNSPPRPPPTARVPSSRPRPSSSS